jgi:hypothetical protein
VSETGDMAVGDLNGDKPYQEVARRTLPVLVRQAKAGQPLSYSQLASELGVHHRTLAWPLGAIGNALLNLGASWQRKVPPIQAVVVNQATGLPGEGIAWFAPDAAAYKDATKRERTRVVSQMLQEVFTFPDWDRVLAEFNLEPVESPASVLPAPEDLLSFGGRGESEAHRTLKHAIAHNPTLVGLPAQVGPGETEAPLYSGDRLDVQFLFGTRRVGIEVKAAGAPDGEIARGMFQCIKYLAVLEAEARAMGHRTECAVRLALGGPLPVRLVGLKNSLGVEVDENVKDAS